MSDNLIIWENLKQVPAACIKPIKAGRLKGMSDINPQWRMQAMTHQFGPCGIGWKYIVTKKWLEDGSEGQKIAFVDINLFFKDNGEWSDAIPGTGGSSFIAKETKGLYTSDEAYKMALTDALSVAMKAIGVAADIYMGAWDGSKYSDTSEATRPPIDKEERKLKNMRDTIIGLLDQENYSDTEKRQVINYHCTTNKCSGLLLSELNLYELQHFVSNMSNTIQGYLGTIN